MNAFNFLSNPVTDALGWTLLHAIWQGFALVLPVAVVLHLLRNKSGVLRYRVGVLTLLSQLLASVCTFFWYYQPVSQTQLLYSTDTVRFATQVRWQAVAQTLPWHQQTQQFLETHLSQFVLVYLIGVALFGLRLAGGWFYLQRISKTAAQPTTSRWAELTDQLRSALAISALVQVRESARIAVPMVVGILKPILLLPIGLATYLSIQEIEAVLAHELAHVKRHDYAVNLLQSVVEVLYFFHPALWWLSARVREEREHCCDDLAVQVCGGNGRVLAQALARVEELRLTQQAQTPTLAMGFAAKRQHLLHRVRRVLGVPTRPFISNGSLAGLTLATILLMSVSVYAVQQESEKPKAQVKQPKPKSTQRFDGTTSGKRIGYNLLDGRLTAIDVNGRRLPKTQVEQIQKQLDRVMSGQLNLDSVSQPNLDILLTIFEKSAGAEGGMAALSKGLDQIDYNTIVSDAMKQVKGMSYDSIVNSAMQQVKTVNYDQIVKKAMASVDTSIFREIEGNVVQYDNAVSSRIQDSLSAVQDLNKGKVALLKGQVQVQQFAIESIERKVERLERQRFAIDQKRLSETSKQQLVIMQSGFARTDSAQAASTKKIAEGEQSIQKVEAEIEKLNGKLIEIQAELEKTRKPLRETESQIRKLENENRRLYLNMVSALGYMSIPETPEPPERTIRGNGHITRPPRPVRPPKAVTIPAPRPNMPVKPVAPVRPKAVPKP